LRHGKRHDDCHPDLSGNFAHIAATCLLRPLPKLIVPDNKFSPDRPGAVVHGLNQCKIAGKLRSPEFDGTFRQPDDLFERGSVNGRQVFVSAPAMREFQHAKLHHSVWSLDKKTGARLDILCRRYIHDPFLTKCGTGSTPSSKLFPRHKPKTPQALSAKSWATSRIAAGQMAPA
jgi:hypothetical protein